MTFDLPQANAVLAACLAEDLGVPVEGLLGGITDPALLERDVTSAAIVPDDAVFDGFVVARSRGVVCGLPLLEALFDMLVRAAGTGPVEVFPLVAEGADVAPGTQVAEVAGPARVVLAGERCALNLLMTLSGIATESRRWSTAVGSGVSVMDTRKTLPGLRALSKYAVRVGGAANHRAGLHDMVLIKDNHLRLGGGIAPTVAAVRAMAPGLRLEVEADTVAQAIEAATAGADVVLLDNMDDVTLVRAVEAVHAVAAESGRSILTEASGGIRFDRLESLITTGVDRISTSALSMARPLDFALDEAEGN
ncbi:MAG: carboxylating nicotinate-nucleotide diphosphorylase [Coriobacteriia bacterium]